MKERGLNVYESDADRYILFSVQREFDTELFRDVTKVDIVRREKVGDKLHIKVVTCANGDIPPALRKLITPKMLTWTETGVWDLTKKVYEYDVKPFFFSNIFKMGGWFRVEQVKPGQLNVHYESDLSINMPLLGGIAEKAILAAQKKNLEEARDRVKRKLGDFKPVFTY